MPVKFVCFNYDRCIEWYIFNALKGLYFLDSSAAAEVARHLYILHPYGTIGKEAWLYPNSVAFGADVERRLPSSYSLIRTFTEQSAQDEIEKIRAVISDAHTLVFLGFSFGSQNMDFLCGKTRDANGKTERVLGTCSGMSERDKRTVEILLKKRFFGGVQAGENKVELVNLKCVDFLKQYGRTLSA